jgi:gluconolactonase
MPLAPDAAAERLATGATWSEGPLWVPELDEVWWSDIKGNRVLAWSQRTGEMREAVRDAEYANGRTRTRDGRIVQCSHGRRAVEVLALDGTTRTLVDRVGGVRLNSPNDVVERSDGSIWFTDPNYGLTSPGEGHPGGVEEYGGRHVFRLDPSGALSAVVTDLDQPNGLAFSPDESVLYVADSARSPGPIHAYDVVSDSVVHARVLRMVEPGIPDGIRVDTEGRIWTSSADSVQVLGPDGTRRARVPVPETVANLCFGGPDGTDLFVAATTSLYRIRTNARDAAHQD